MLVVSNTSPICNLAVIDRLDLLRRRYATISIPVAVATELGRLTHRDGAQRIAAALSAGWLRVQTADFIPTLPFPLDAGETEAVALALQVKADVLLIDEKRGREAARTLGMAVAGILGELIYATNAGWISSVRLEIERLRRDAGFFIDATVERFILSQVGE